MLLVFMQYAMPVIVLIVIFMQQIGMARRVLASCGGATQRALSAGAAVLFLLKSVC